MEMLKVKINKPQDVNIVMGQAHFIKTIEDLYEALSTSSTSLKFGIAFCESSGPCLVRYEGNDEELIGVAVDNAKNIGAGHMFFIALRGGFPINVLNSIKMVQEVCRIFCATANDVEVIVVQTAQGRGVLGVVDGEFIKGVESKEDMQKRKEFLRKIGYKR